MQEPWKLPANELAAYVAGLRAAADVLEQRIYLLKVPAVTVDPPEHLRVHVELTGLERQLRREAYLLDGFAQETLAEAEAAEEDPDALAAAVAEDLHLRPDSPLAKMQAGMRRAGQLLAAELGIETTPPQNQVPAEAGGAAAAQSEAKAASPSGVEGPATTPSPAGGLLDGDTRKWTPLRDLLLAQLWPTSTPVLAMHRELLKLPGDSIVATAPHYRAEKVLGLGARGDAPAPTDMPLLIDSLRAELTEAAAMVRDGMRAKALAEHFGWPLATAQELCAEVDAEGDRAA